MKEESHLEEMRAALRGDRERAEQARQRSFENVRALVDAAPAAEQQEPAADEPAPPEEPRRGRLGFLRRR